MTIRRRKRKPLGDSGASSDIAFLLIIYFIVIAGFSVNKGFLLALPARDSRRFIPREELFRFYLDPAGRLSLGGEPCDLAAAEREIRRGMAARPNTAVLLTVDPQTPWQAVVEFVELARDLDVDSFSFVMGEAPGGGP
ncbi:MAG: biopolymer transporter ExbD [Treponema sp.]|jgi:biopolymer transport protein ExbD|nr:biopolymer transporter ExbD [Treponema sp.]